MTTIKIAFPTDEHYPFQDEAARSVALQIVRDFNPDEIVAGSDGLDFYQLSKFNKDPARMKALNLQSDIQAWMAGQREWMDAAPGARRRFIGGNHEDRLRKYLWQNPELSDLEALTLPNLLNFYKIGIQGEAEAELTYGRDLVIKHGSVASKYSAYSAKSELEADRYSISTMSGHTHRGGSFYARTRFGVVQAHECFCLCSLEPEYVLHPNWQQGITLATISKLGLTVEAVAFLRKSRKVSAVWRGKEYRQA